MTGYASAAGEYWGKSWRGVLVLPRGQKYPPPKGTTGYEGFYPSWGDVTAWSESQPDGNLALRLPNTVVGIDVDAYNGKTGGQTLAEAERRWGALPPTWRSTARNDGVSGIRLYRVEAGVELETTIGFPEHGLGNIEVCQFYHRFVVAWPSVHPDTGRTYRWLDHSGMESDIPREGHLPFLPEAWVEALGKAAGATGLASADVSEALAGLTSGPISPQVQQVLAKALMDLTGNPESRHDVTLRHVLDLLYESDKGHSGVRGALEQLEGAFVRVVGRDRGEEAARLEFRRMVEGQRGHDLIATYPSVEGLTGISKPPPAPSPTPVSSVQEPPCREADGVARHESGEWDAADDYALLGRPAPEPAGVDTGNRTSWGPVDINQLLDADVEPELPTEFFMSVPVMPLFYPGRVNGFVGEPESAKSWLAQVASAQAIQEGRKVLYLDFEDIGRNIISRLRLLGCSDDQIRANFAYVEPDGPLGAEEQEELFAAVDEGRPAVIAVDGVNAAMTMMGLDLERNTDAIQFHKFLLKPLTRQDAAVIIVDHVPKNKMGRGGFAIGAQAKKAMVDGALIGVTCTVPFGKGRLGELSLVVLKDKIGEVRSAAEKRGNDDYLATVEVDARKEGVVNFFISKKNGGGESGISKMESEMIFRMAAISKFMEVAGVEEPLSFNVINTEMKGKRALNKDALAQLVDRGCLKVEDGPRGAKMHTFVRAYQPNDLDMLDALVTGSPD